MTDVLRDQLQTTLGSHYIVERELGGGGMSRVFLAREPGLGRHVAIKVLPAEMTNQVSLERFRREIRIAASLQQANIVPVLSAADNAGMAYFIMPFVAGEDLRLHLREHGPLPIREVVSIVRDIARALAFAHDRGVVHRDIKPANVLLSGNTAVVTDFGIAKAFEASRTSAESLTLTEIGSALGTPTYLAPEQAAGSTAVDHRADIYALGVLSFELLVGHPPFIAANPQAVLAAHITQPPPELSGRRPDAPRDLSSLVMRCLAKEPGDRPQRAQEIVDALEALSSPSISLAPHTGVERKPGVAVLPFVNLSASADEEYFSDGVTEDIIAQLSQIASLKVISRTSVMRYKRTSKGTKEIASELGASHIIEGTVRRSVNRLRIVAQLIDAATDSHLWAETFDREMTDVFAVQTEVAERVTAALRARLSQGERRRFGRRPTDDLEAYNLYLLGRHHFNSATAEGFARSISSFEEAIERDPGFARAYASLALAYDWHTLGYYGMKPRDAWEKVLPLVTKAIELDPELPEAHMMLGRYEQLFRLNWNASAAYFERAIALSPSFAYAHLCYALVFATTGRYDEAIDAADRAIELDPGSEIVRLFAAFVCHVVRRQDAALARLDAAERQLENVGILPLVRCEVLLAMGRAPEAVPIIRRVVERIPGTFVRVHLAWFLAAAGERNEARALLDDLHRCETVEYVWPQGIALTYAHLGDLDRAFEYLERSYDDRVGWIMVVDCAPTFDLLRGDSRFESLQRRVGGNPHPALGSMRRGAV